ncbi:response regulator transcription factor [Sulfurimonas sp. MAG313]|nr:response regulator [Sulfurimonas sp. MAG313]MDF1880326.1 response regulator transcription factor [Sulfurimonas sp. MAG313]
MQVNEKWDVLYIKDDTSLFDVNTKVFDEVFRRVDKVQGREDALRLFNNNLYDMVICDLSVDPEEIAFMKQLKDKKPKMTIFVLVDEKDTDKVYGFADLNMNAFILSPDQFDEALAEIARFDPYA